MVEARCMFPDSPTCSTGRNGMYTTTGVEFFETEEYYQAKPTKVIFISGITSQGKVARGTTVIPKDAFMKHIYGKFLERKELLPLLLGLDADLDKLITEKLRE